MRAGSFADGNLIIGTNIDTAGINSGMKQIERTLKHFHVFSAKMLGIGGLLMLGKTAVKAASDLQEVQNIVDVTFGDLSDKMEDFASISIEAYGMSEFMAKSIAGSFMAMGKASGIAADDAANMALQLTALAGDMASFYNIQQETARVALSAVYTGETETLKRYGIILTEANLQEYAASIGIKAKVKQMDASTKALLRYRYILEQTQHIQGDFIRTQDNWANQMRVLKERWKQLLITIGNGLITLGAPVLKSLNNIVQALTHFANVVGEILSRLLGIQWQDVTAEMAQLADGTSEAAESEEDLADGIGNATKKAKKMIQPFDELNVLTTKASDGAGGLADELGLAVADFDTAFDVQGGGWDFEVPDISSWYEFGKFLSDTLKGLLDDIDWAGIQQHATTFAHNLADFLNGIFQPDTFASIGHTIAEALNTAVDFAFEFGTTFDFENLGKTIAAGVNQFFTDFDFAQFGETISVWIDGLWEAVKTFFWGDENGEGGIDWPLIRKKLAEFFDNLSVEAKVVISYLLIKKILKMSFASAAIKAVATAFGKLLGSIMGEIAVRNAMKKSIPLLFGQSWFQRLAAFLKGKFAGTGLVTMEQAGASAGSSFLAGFQTVATGLVGILTAIFGGLRIGVSGGAVLGELFGGDTSAYDPYMKFGGTITMLKDLGKAIADVATDFGLFKDTAKAMFEDSIFADMLPAITTGFETIKTWFKNTGDGIASVFINAKTDIINTWAEITDWFNTTIIGIIGFFQNLWTNVKSIFTSLVVTIQAIWSSLTAWFNLNIIQPLIASFKNFWTNVKSFFQNLWNDIKAIWGTVKTWFQTNVIIPVQVAFANWKIAITTLFTNLWNDIQTTWSNVATWFDTNVIQPLLGFFNTLWDGITQGVKDAMNFAIGIVEGFINKIIDAINTFTSGISTIASAAAKITGDDYTAIASIQHVSLPRLANGAVIPPNKEFMAILGDQTSGTNIEAPLDTIVDAFKMALSENDSTTMMNLMAQQVELLSVIADKCGITDRQIFNSVRKSASQYTKMTGQTAF